MLRTHVITGKMLLLLLSHVRSGMRTESGTREGLEPVDDAISIENESVSCSVVAGSVTPWTVAYQAPLSMDFSRQEYWSELPFPSPRYLSHPWIQPRIQTLFSCIVGGFFTIWATREAKTLCNVSGRTGQRLGKHAYALWSHFPSKVCWKRNISKAKKRSREQLISTSILDVVCVLFCYE